jgi:hypothetical protein
VFAGTASAGGLIDFGFANRVGFAKSPLMTKERTTIINDRMCLGIHASLTYFDFFGRVLTISFNDTLGNSFMLGN